MRKNEASQLRLASVVLMEISEDWKTGELYLKPEKNGRTTGRK
jgi:hypothetical protein